MSFYRIPWGASTVMLVTMFLGTFVTAITDQVANGETNVTALVIAGISAVVAAISRTFQAYTASKDPAIEPEPNDV